MTNVAGLGNRYQRQASARNCRVNSVRKQIRNGHEFTRLRAFSSLTRIEREKPALSFLYI